MAWNGYFALGGNEFINTSRTEAYGRSQSGGWFRPTYKPDPNVFRFFGDQQAYRSPFHDENVPWVDPDDPSSVEFLGVYPLEITGLEDSTRSSTVVESALDGGSPGRVRHGTKQIVFSCLMLAASEEGNDSGMRWLRNVLLAGPCDSLTRPGAQLCYFSSEPCSPKGEDYCADDYRRYLYDVAVITGPTVTGKRTTTNGGAVWNVTFTAVAGNPFEFGEPVRPFDYDWFSPQDDAHVPNDTFTLVPRQPPLVPVGAGGVLRPRPPHQPRYPNQGGYNVPELTCPTSTYQPVYDPACPVLIPPPVVPSIPVNCFTLPKTWHRYYFSVVRNSPKPKFLIQAERDELCPLKRAYEFYAQLAEPKELVVIDGADHLFDGKMAEVADAIEDLLGDWSG